MTATRPGDLRMEVPQTQVGFSQFAEFAKSDDEWQYTLCPVLIPEKFDLQHDWVSADEIRKAVWGMGTHDRVLDLEHFLVDEDLGTPVEKYVLPADTLFLKTASPAPALQTILDTISDLQKTAADQFRDDVRLVPKGSGMLGAVWKRADVWEKIKKGDLRGMSIYGKGVRTPFESED